MTDTAATTTINPSILTPAQLAQYNQAKSAGLSDAQILALFQQSQATASAPAPTAQSLGLVAIVEAAVKTEVAKAKEYLESFYKDALADIKASEAKIVTEFKTHEFVTGLFAGTLLGIGIIELLKHF